MALCLEPASIKSSRTTFIFIFLLIHFLKVDILEVLKKMDDNQYVIFESCVLYYLDEEKRLETEKEITRVSGGDRFNVRMKPYILLDKFYWLPFVMC